MRQQLIRPTAFVIVFVAAALAYSPGANAATRTRWDVWCNFTEATGGVSSGIGTPRLVWGDPATNSAEISAQHFYGDALPSTFELFLTLQNGNTVSTSLISGGRLALIAQKCIETASGCTPEASSRLEQMLSFDVISTENKGDPENDPDGFVIRGAQLSAWTSEDYSATFRLLFQKRSAPSPRKADAARSTAEPDYRIADVSAVAGKGFVREGTARPHKIDVPVQIESSDADRGLRSVVVLGSTAFSPSALDLATLSFGAGDARPVSTSWADVNADGITDLVLQFRSDALSTHSGSEDMLRLAGRTFDGQLVTGWVAARPPSSR